MSRDAAEAALRPNRIPWPPLLFLAVAGAAWVLEMMYGLPIPEVGGGLRSGLGLLLGLAGIGLMSWAFWTMRRHGTTVLPDAPASRLVTTGPFALSRNPIYVGDTLILAGVALYAGSIWFALAAVLFVILVHKLAVLPEERHLDALFGEPYRAYQARTRRWL